MTTDGDGPARRDASGDAGDAVSGAPDEAGPARASTDPVPAQGSPVPAPASASARAPAPTPAFASDEPAPPASAPVPAPTQRAPAPTPASAEPAHSRVPRLARDATRQLVSLAIMTGVMTLAAIAVPLAVIAWGDIAAFVEVERFPFVIATTGVGIFVFGATYAWLTARVFGRRAGDGLRRLANDSAARSARSRLALRLLMGDEITLPVATALMALLGVVVIVVLPAFSRTPMLIVGAIALLTGGWIMLIVSFATSYLREWAAHDSIVFPEPAAVDGEASPDRRYGDFIYLAGQLATTFSSSDAQLVRTRVRSLATVNAIVAFLYNTVIIGMFLSFAVSAGLSA